MLRKHAILLAPAAPPIDIATGGSRQLTKSWMESLPSLTEPAPTEPAAGEKGTNGKADSDDGAGATAGNGVAAKPAAAPAGDVKPGAAEAPKPAGKPAGEAAPEDPDDEKWPRSSDDWKKFRAGRAAKETKLREQILERETRLYEAQSRIAELEKTSANTPAIDPAVAEELKQMKALNAELSTRIAVLDVTKDPRFEDYFGQKVKAAHQDVKDIIGPEKGEAFIKLLGLPDGEYKTAQLNEFYSELGPVEQSELGAVRTSLRSIDRERNAEIEKANATKDKLVAERKSRADTTRQTYEAAFTSTVKLLQDPKTGFATFQKRPEGEEGAAEWNAAVDRRIADAKSRLMGQNKPEQIVRTAFDAVALPAVLEAYKADQAEWAAEKATLEAQVKELTAAQPGAGGGAETGSPGVKPVPKPKTDVPPHVLARQWGEDMARRMNEPVQS